MTTTTIAKLMNDYGFEIVDTDGNGTYVGTINSIDYTVDCSELPCYIYTESDKDGYQFCFYDADKLLDCVEQLILNPHLKTYL